MQFAQKVYYSKVNKAIDVVLAELDIILHKYGKINYGLGNYNNLQFCF